MTDPDIIAVAFMARAALYEMAKMKSPDDPLRELKRMRDDILDRVRRQRFTGEHSTTEVEIKARVYDAVITLMPLTDDSGTLQ